MTAGTDDRQVDLVVDAQWREVHDDRRVSVGEQVGKIIVDMCDAVLGSGSFGSGA